MPIAIAPAKGLIAISQSPENSSAWGMPMNTTIIMWPATMFASSRMVSEAQRITTTCSSSIGISRM